MDHVNHFKDLFKSIPEHRKIVIILFLFKNDADLSTECGFFKNDNNSLNEEFKKSLVEQNERNLDFFKNEESIIEKTLKN